MPEHTLARIKSEKLNPTEAAKLEKDPVSAWTDIYDFAKKVRRGINVLKAVLHAHGQ